MAYEMESSSTANAAKLAVLWRDRDKKPATPGSGGGSGSVPDHFVEDVFEGGILDAIIPPPAGSSTTNPDGSVTPGVVPEPTLVDRKTVYTDSQNLKSIYAAVQDLRAIIVDPMSQNAPGPTDPLFPLTEDEENTGPVGSTWPFFGGDLHATFTDLRAVTHGTSIVFGDAGMQRAVEVLRAAGGGNGLSSILDILIDLRESIYGDFGGPGMTESVGEWLVSTGRDEEMPGITSGLLTLIQEFARRLDIIETQVVERLTAIEEDLVSLESRVATLTEDYTSLSQRVGVIESGTGGQA